MDGDGTFTIKWESKLKELRKKATEAYAKENPNTGAMGHEIPIEEGSDDWNKIYEAYDWIPGAFDSLQKLPHPKHSKSMANQIAKVAGNNDMSEVVNDGEVDKGAVESTVDASGGFLSGKALHDDVSHYVSGWTGDGATSFRGFFGDIPGVIDNQSFVAKFLGVTMEANQGMLLSARRDSEKIPDATITSLEALSGGTSAEDGATTLSIVAAVATVAAGFATLPAGGAAIVAGGLTVLAGISSGASLAADAEAKAKDEMPIKGDTVDQVLSGMMDCVTKVTTSLTEGEDKLIEKLNSSTEVMQSQRDQFIAPRPKTLINDGASEFRPPTV